MVVHEETEDSILVLYFVIFNIKILGLYPIHGSFKSKPSGERKPSFVTSKNISQSLFSHITIFVIKIIGRRHSTIVMVCFKITPRLRACVYEFFVQNCEICNTYNMTNRNPYGRLQENKFCATSFRSSRLARSILSPPRSHTNSLHRI